MRNKGLFHLLTNRCSPCYHDGTGNKKHERRAVYGDTQFETTRLRALMARTKKERIEPSDFARRVAKYFRECDGTAVCKTCEHAADSEACAKCKKRRKRPYTISGLCLSIGITKREFAELRRNKCFSDEVEMALLKIEAYIEENSILGDIGATLALALLKEHFGWGKKTDAAETMTVLLSKEADALAE